MKEKIEDVVKVSAKGQIVIPKEIRDKLSVGSGEKLLVITRDKEILLRKLEKLSIEEIGEKVERIAKGKNVDIDKLISEAIEWAKSST